ncbi:MAG: hypothetical protein JO069_14080 [Verrucomicrobia bacterium]|nr:hypothetical protein [Verrucomicrobiota bacterium]
MRVRDALAYPFKVLRDVFTDPPFVPDPEFTRIDLDALGGQDSGSGCASRPRLVRPGREKISIPVWLLLLVAILIALMIIG